jgi:hypothetical protein
VSQPVPPGGDPGLPGDSPVILPAQVRQGDSEQQGAGGHRGALSDVHRQYLNGHAVCDAVIGQQAIRSEGEMIVFTWREGDHVTEQRRPWPGEGGVYFWTTGADLHLNVIRDPGPDAPVLLCEGTKQSLAVASWAPPQYAVIGMPGCYGWTMSRHLDLARFAGRQVFILLDADAAENLDVYEAGTRLASELAMEDPPAIPKFLPSPAWGKSGIDDYLGRIAEGRRTDRLAKLIEKAQDKPADRKPTKRKHAVPDTAQPDTAGRKAVVINKDRMLVIGEIINALRDRWDGTELFGYGGALTRLRNGQTEPLGKGAFLLQLPTAVACYKYTPPGTTTPGKYEDSWPDRETVEALLASAGEFTQLDRVVKMPFIRSDGTVCAKNGYDAASHTFLALGNSGMDRLDIPDAPSRDDARAAARFLLDDWLGDSGGRSGFPFRDDASRAGVLALVLTPFIRGLVPLVPLAVISGLQMGVGKNLLADCISLLTTGDTCVPLPWIKDNDEEIRKQILSAFRAGSSLFCFDEAHDIGGIALSRALTAITYTDRVLGVSQMASYPNQVTWMSLGNQVQVLGDMARRHYRIELYPAAPDPQDRDERSFAHPDIRSWTRENRPELITAALVMIRAWFTAKCPASPRGSLMGSFEAWDKMVSGILGYAEVPGFLSEMIGQRTAGDLSAGYWREHLAWSVRVWSNSPHTCRDVKNKASAASGDWEAPPGLDFVMQEGYAKKLGEAYHKIQDRWFGPYRIVKQGQGSGHVTQWVVETREGGPLAPPVPPVTPPADGGPQTGMGGPQTGMGGLQKTEGGVAEDETLPDLRFNQNGGLGDPGGPLPQLPYREKKDVPVFSGSTPADSRSEEQESFSRVCAMGSGPLGPLGPLSFVFDLEGASADELFRYTERDEIGYVRLAGIIGPSGDPKIVPTPDLLAMLEIAPEITGHNILGFDLLALARHHGADYDKLAAKARDTELIARQADPPRSRDTQGSVDHYDLTSVAERYDVPGKSDDLKRLKQKFGGYDMIPLDDQEYRSYLEGDLVSTAAVSAAMRANEARYGTDPYVAREHRLAALAGRMTLNGFRVDVPLLSERLRAAEGHKQDALSLLHAGWGLSLSKTVTRGRGKAKHDVEELVKSPLSTDAGRAWLAAQYERYGVPDPPRTLKTGKLALGAEALRPLLADPRCTGSLRDMLTLMAIVTTTRTVYQTASVSLTSEGRVHPSNSFRQASGRWSVTNPGLTVFGKRGGRHIERDIFLPDEGHVLLSFDLSQVDMRAMAWLSGDHAYRALFAPGRDAHSEIAAQVGIKRQDAKAIGHGWNYGLGAQSMIDGGPGRPPIDEALVRAFMTGMEERFPQLIRWRETIRERGKAGDILDNGFGRRMRCDPERAYTVAPALMGQGGARDIMGECLLRLSHEVWPYLRVMVHDEIVCSVPVEDASEIAGIFLNAMTWQLDDDLPVLCDMSGGASWGAASAK